MKDDNLPPDNETVEDGGGNYVAGSREEYNAYLNYEDVQKELETAKEELTRLRSELQQKDVEIDFLKSQIADLRIYYKDSGPF